MNRKDESSEIVKNYYNETLRGLPTDYISWRWGETEIKRSHYKQTERTILRVCELMKGCKSVLEVGCGPAVWTPYYIDHVTDLTLLDISEEMLSRAQDRLKAYDRVTYRCGDFAKIESLPRGQYDAILSVRAFEYMENKPHIIEKCFSLLRPGGRLYIITKNREWCDLKRELRSREMNLSSTHPVGEVIQNNVVSWRDILSWFTQAGFVQTEANPVILGSYYPPLNYRVGQILCDQVQRMVYSHDMNRWWSYFSESCLISGIKQ